MKLLLCALLPAVLVAQTIVDLAVATPQLSTLVAVLTTPAFKPVLTALSGKGPFTVFAPTDAAFKAAGVDTSDVAAVTNVLQYHVLQGAVMAKDLASSQAPIMLNGARAIIKSSSAGVTAAGAKVVIPNVKATNGVVHVVDKVMLPPSSSVVDLAVATPVVSTLVTVLKMPAFKGILEALSGKGPFTVFAPTNDAFAAAGVDTTDTNAVAAVLKYHVLQGAVYSDDLEASQDVATLNGAKVTVKKTVDGVTVNDAKVVVADVAGTNGIVHVIDKVLIPPAKATVTTSTAPAMPLYTTAPAVSLYTARPTITAPVYSAPVTSQWGGYFGAPLAQTRVATPLYSAGPAIASYPAPVSNWGGYFGSSFAAAPVSYNNNWNFGAVVSPFVSNGVSTGYNGWGGVSTPYSYSGLGGYGYSSGLNGWGGAGSSPYTWGYSGFGR